ncbi:hypothetical protein KOR42_53370 [Thalassoglobus neptunius]|uniref:Uncharacterized protein n=1 Tax=Thalassoglobus neptunius TaxID=1938619 RepID=A0A5C5VAM1_9PLAN|nr:hypothetical protein [Thalassoglobus neptunius]TWT34987.1 hypothetical protein KOR42_53370 [Thalassoglobus neptunius]
MTTFLVATLSRYVLVDAADEDQARQLAKPGLEELYAKERERFGNDFPIEILTVRPATQEEIDLWNWHHQMIASHAT